MVLNTQPQVSEQTSSYASKTWNWKWEKRHWLIVIALGCLALWWLGSKITEWSWFKPIISSLPLIGSACFAAEAIVKLSR